MIGFALADQRIILVGHFFLNGVTLQYVPSLAPSINDPLLSVLSLGSGYSCARRKEANRDRQGDCRLGLFFMDAAEGVENIEPDDNDRSSREFWLDEIRGWSGLIELGAAWQSIDIFRALAYSLDFNQSPGLKILALLRIDELKSEGVTSIHPNPDGEFREIKLNASLNHHQRKQIEKWFRMAREKSDERHRKRTDYLMDRLLKDQHPDTHPDFWNEWDEPDFPTLTSLPFWTDGRIFGTIFGLISLTLITLKIWYDRRHKKKARPAAA